MRPHATYAFSLSEYIGFFRTCGDLLPYEVETAIHYSQELARIRWQLRGEGSEDDQAPAIPGTFMRPGYPGDINDPERFPGED